MPPRTSARLKERVENRSPVLPSCNIKSKASTSHPPKKQKSNAAKSNTKEFAKEMQYTMVKGRKGKLRLMTEMPMDILFEIFAQLEPVDLLHLSRANKGLRNILVASSATFLWKLSYKNLSHPPPECPPGVNLRHYTNFLFGRNCHFCASVHGKHILHWAARARLCQKCTRKHLNELSSWGLSLKEHSFLLPPPLENEALRLTSVCSITINSISSRYILKAEYDHILQALQATGNDAAALGALVRKQERFKSYSHENVSSIQRWWNQRQAGLEELRKKRKTEIIQRIRAEGYGNELSAFVIQRLPGLKNKSTKELSDKDWERIKPRLIRVLEYKRREEIEEKVVDKFIARFWQLSRIASRSYPKVFPPIAHLVRTPPFIDLIKNTVISEQITDRELEGLTPHIADITASWRESADQCLLDLLPQLRSRKGKGKQISTRSLELATSFFKCYWCTEPISYPRILMHECLRVRSETEDADEEDTDEEDEKIEEFSQNIVDSVWAQMPFWFGTGWNEGNDEITFDDEASGFARVIVKACGQNPDKVTFDQMNEIDARVECLRCSNSGGRNRKRLVMNWTTAILHDIDKHFEKVPDEKGWALISKEDTTKAKELEFRRFPNRHYWGTTTLDASMKRYPYAVKI